MRLSKLYANNGTVFEPVTFEPGLNVIRAEIRVPANRQKNTHNLGKTTLGHLINFALLSKRHSKFFLFKHIEIFRDFVFFLEVERPDGSFVTVRRSVEHASKISLRSHAGRHLDLSDLPEAEWDHAGVPFDRAKEILDGILDLRVLKPWSYRKVVGYLIRAQADFGQVFQLKKFSAAHSDWKPFLAHLLGFDGQLVARHYAKEGELEKEQAQESVIQRELGGGSVADLSKVEGMLQLKRRDADRRAQLLDAFDFREDDRLQTSLVADELDSRIAELNGERYTLAATRKKVAAAIADDDILFDPNKASEVFKDAGVLFPDQLKKDFQQLIAFNREITEERSAYLKEELAEIETSLNKVNEALHDLGRRRTEALAFLGTSDTFEKYKALTDELVTLRADIKSLERQREFVGRLQALRARIRRLAEEKEHLQAEVEANVERNNSDSSSMFSSVRLYFDEIVERVIDRKALLSVSPNRFGHLEFQADILDESGNATSADLGNTYRKLLCMAFDLALARAHFEDRYPRWVFHDGALESLDDRTKRNLVDLLREYSSLGIQIIVTAIDSDIPSDSEDGGEVFTASEIIVQLHDEGDDGRLFKMASW
ncbi:MAG: DUF2326 domain-containing protein [Myxococcales bacterium]|nr:DUF2326 domain-containing protein [Myxococcales bacterium]